MDKLSRFTGQPGSWFVNIHVSPSLEHRWYVSRLQPQSRYHDLESTNKMIRFRENFSRQPLKRHCQYQRRYTFRTTVAIAFRNGVGGTAPRWCQTTRSLVMLLQTPDERCRGIPHVLSCRQCTFGFNSRRRIEDSSAVRGLPFSVLNAVRAVENRRATSLGSGILFRRCLTRFRTRSRNRRRSARSPRIRRASPSATTLSAFTTRPSRRPAGMESLRPRRPHIAIKCPRARSACTVSVVALA